MAKAPDLTNRELLEALTAQVMTLTTGLDQRLSAVQDQLTGVRQMLSDVQLTVINTQAGV